MPPALSSTLLLTLLRPLGLVFPFLAGRQARNRTTVVDVHSPRPALEVLDQVSGRVAATTGLAG